MSDIKRDPDESYSQAETEARREALLKRILATPPKPRSPNKRKPKESSQSK